MFSFIIKLRVNLNCHFYFMYHQTNLMPLTYYQENLSFWKPGQFSYKIITVDGAHVTGGFFYHFCLGVGLKCTVTK